MADTMSALGKLFSRFKKESKTGAAKPRDVARTVDYAALTAIEDALNFGVERKARFPAQMLPSADAPRQIRLRVKPAAFAPVDQERESRKEAKDYGKMLARYVRGSPREQRLLIYDRARQALVNQEPPLQPSELENERMLLDAAIEKLEAEET